MSAWNLTPTEDGPIWERWVGELRLVVRSGSVAPRPWLLTVRRLGLNSILLSVSPTEPATVACAAAEVAVAQYVEDLYNWTRQLSAHAS